MSKEIFQFELTKDEVATFIAGINELIIACEERGNYGFNKVLVSDARALLHKILTQEIPSAEEPEEETESPTTFAGNLAAELERWAKLSRGIIIPLNKNEGLSDSFIQSMKRKILKKDIEKPEGNDDKDSSSIPETREYFTLDTLEKGRDYLFGTKHKC